LNLGRLTVVEDLLSTTLEKATNPFENNSRQAEPNRTAGFRYSQNLSAGWTCQPCSTTSTQPPPAPPSVPPTRQPVVSTTALVTGLHSTPLSKSGSCSGLPHTLSSTFRILQFNLAGLISRPVKLLKFLQDDHIDVACLQETNLGGGAEPPRLSGWQLVGRMDCRVNRDRQPTRTYHGGVAFLVREGVHYEDKPDVATSAVDPNDDTTECSAIKIHDPRLVKPVTILNVQCSSNVPPIRAVDGRDQCFDPIFLPTTSDTFVLGDFNAHSLTWDPNSP